MSGPAPLVSVVLPVWNGAQDLEEAVRSILGQTFADFELVALNDCSTRDNSGEILDRLAKEDARIRVIHHDVNRGLAGTLNHGIELARGRYIARQDQDDVSRPTRLAEQVAFMEANPRCGLLGTRAEIWVEGRPSGRVHDHPLGNVELQIALLANNPFVHSSVMMRRTVLEETGPYATDKARQPPEDYEMWSRMARRCEVANLAGRLLVYREVQGSMSRVGANPFLDKLILLSAENIAHWSGSSESGPARDAAALIHAAYDRLSAAADIKVICAVADRACAGIEEAAGRDGPGVTPSQARMALIADIGHHYVCARQMPNWVAAMRGRAGGLPLPAGLKQRVKRWMASQR